MQARHFSLYVGGQLVDTDRHAEVVNPANGEVVGTIACADEGLVNQTLEQAQEAFPSWSTLDPAERADWMDRLREAVIAKADFLTELVHLELGKPWAMAQEDYQMLPDSLAFYAEEARKLGSSDLPDPDGTHTHEIIREPIGVVGAFLAWNFPLLNLAYKIGPALASGCPIIIKPSIKTPLSAYAVGAICHEIGLPAGAVNIIGGDDASLGDVISASPIPAMLTLIGSTQTGVHIMKTGATSIKRYSMELGGNAPVLVFDDADLDLAADIITALKFGNSGQICVAPNRVFADAAIRNALATKIVERANAIKVGFGRDDNFGMGPVIDKRSRDRIASMVSDAVEEGAQLLAGGSIPGGLEGGAFYAPTVVGGISNNMKIAQEEIFGPVVTMMEPLEGEDALIAAANDTEAGLTSYVFTRNSERARRVASKLRFGEVQINGVRYHISLPHCGLKQSGIGVDCSHLALDDFFATKRISTAIL